MQKIKLNYKYILSGTFLAGLILVLCTFAISASFSDAKYKFNKTGTTNLYPDIPVTQIFQASENNLSGISISIKRPLGWRQKISIQLADQNCEKVIAQDVLFLDNPFSEKHYRLKFDRLTDSAEKFYCLKITFLGERKKKGDLPSISTSKSERTMGFSYDNPGKSGLKENSSLLIEPSYTSDKKLVDTGELINRMSQYKPWFFKDIFLYALIIVFLVLTAALVIVLIIV